MVVDIRRLRNSSGIAHDYHILLKLRESNILVKSGAAILVCLNFNMPKYFV